MNDPCIFSFQSYQCSQMSQNSSNWILESPCVALPWQLQQQTYHDIVVILTDILEQVECALTLYSHQMIGETPNTKSKGIRLFVQKAINSGTGIPSTVHKDFSSNVWDQSTSYFLTSVKAQTQKQIKDIFEACSDLQCKGNTYSKLVPMNQGVSSHANLHSNSDDSRGMTEMEEND